MDRGSGSMIARTVAVRRGPVASGGSPKNAQILWMGGLAMWTKPVVVEVAVGLEINCYACADL
jgi:coenzyme PQQ precursor peptide PqqA